MVCNGAGGAGFGGVVGWGGARLALDMMEVTDRDGTDWRDGGAERWNRGVVFKDVGVMEGCDLACSSDTLELQRPVYTEEIRDVWWRPRGKRFLRNHNAFSTGSCSQALTFRPVLG